MILHCEAVARSSILRTAHLLHAVTLVGFALTTAADPLETGFRILPDSARPLTWWHWMNGNITKAGITADLESMKRVGIAGADIINVANTSIVNIPAGPVDYLSPEWLELVKFSATEADRLGLKLGLANSAGWSGTGGPWVTPENSMKKLVWSEAQVSGGNSQSIQLAQPPTKMDFYRDVAVLAFPTPQSKTALIPMADILNLTGKLAVDGRLNWQRPTGDWTVLRIGYTTNGRNVRPAPKSGTGLETDKLSREALDDHWKAGIQPVLDKLGPLTGKVMTSILLDSYEAFGQDWTAAMPAEFKRLRGYDLIPYLPVLTGRVVVSREVSDRFLWDHKRTVSDLFAENFYDYFAVKCHQAGLLFACEPYGNADFDTLRAGAKNDIPMTEFWVNSGGGGKSAASLAHTHGQTFAGAEAFTGRPPDSGRWQSYPGLLKGIGDRMWCDGINRFYFHSIPHQPWLDKFPGMTMGKYGTHFGRTTTWWEQSSAWMNYLARGQFLLQQGRFVADVLLFAGESPTASAGKAGRSLRAAGYDFDLCGIDLIDQLRVEDGFVVLPSGVRYRLLILENSSRLTPTVAAKVRDLVRAGAVVMAQRPSGSPSLESFPKCDSEVQAIAAEVWGADEAASVGWRSFGKGRIIWGRKLFDVLEDLSLKPDFAAAPPDANLLFIHRRADDGDIYFISNQADEFKTVQCTFRVKGHRPELWDAVTGEMQLAGLWQPGADHTRVTLSLGPKGSLFVVFRKAAPSNEMTLTAVRNETISDPQKLPEVITTSDARLLAWDNGRYTLCTSAGGEKSVTVNGVPKPIALYQSWSVDFTPGWGAPDRIELPQLLDWTKHSDPGVRYYSGTGTYRTVVKLPADFLANSDRFELDLGEVRVSAEVILNGQNLGIVWCRPFRVDITKAAKVGDNSLEVRVVNLWPNRLIGDEQYPSDVTWATQGLKNWPEWLKNGTPRPSANRLTFATWHHWNKDDALLPSGLLGPVQVRVGQLVDIAQ